MDKENTDFETWFDTVAITVLDKTDVEFRDEDSVREDYHDGKDAYAVADEIAAEYGE